MTNAHGEIKRLLSRVERAVATLERMTLRGSPGGHEPALLRRGLFDDKAPSYVGPALEEIDSQCDSLIDNCEEAKRDHRPNNEVYWWTYEDVFGSFAGLDLAIELKKRYSSELRIFAKLPPATIFDPLIGALKRLPSGQTDSWFEGRPSIEKLSGFQRVIAEAKATIPGIRAALKI